MLRWERILEKSFGDLKHRLGALEVDGHPRRKDGRTKTWNDCIKRP